MDLCYEIKFENHVKDKNDFFIKRNISFLFLKQKYILFLQTYFFKIPKNLTPSEFFLPRQILKNIYMPRQKPRPLPTAKTNFERCFHHYVTPTQPIFIKH